MRKNDEDMIPVIIAVLNDDLKFTQEAKDFYGDRCSVFFDVENFRRCQSRIDRLQNVLKHLRRLDVSGGETCQKDFLTM